MTDAQRSRRRLLQFAAASPLALAGTALHDLTAGFQQVAGTAVRPAPDGVISDIKEALDVFDFEAAARKALPPAHYGYLATGTDDDGTVRANREAFARYQLRTRRLVNVAAPDITVTLFGATYASPIVLAPVSSLRAFHADGEIAVARGARAQRNLQVLSTLSSNAVERVNEARGEPVWFQLYPTNDWPTTRAIVARADRAGAPVLVLTVDNLGNNRLTQERLTRQDPRTCTSCHTVTGPRFFVTRPIFEGLDMSRASRLTPHDWNWDFVARLRELTRMKIVLKGIVTREDAERAVTAGVDGLIVSNHGGRSEDSGRGAIECLREVVDSGFRRGTDIFKALAMGATAVCIGRPYVWGLAAFGQPGVEAVLTMLKRELELVMRQAGTPSLARVDGSYVIDRGKY
jgi:4-hydroxymandelate oxidase